MRFKRRGWDFSAGRVITQLHEDKDFRKAAEECVIDFKGEDFWGSPYAELLDKLTGGAFSKRKAWHDSGVWILGAFSTVCGRICTPVRAPSKSCMCLMRIKCMHVRSHAFAWHINLHLCNSHTSLRVGSDAGNMFNSRSWSSTVVGLRCFTLAADRNAKRFAWAPLLVIAGPTEPAKFQHILAPTVDWFCKHDPGASRRLLSCECCGACVSKCAALRLSIRHPATAI